jgi:hypothetical protein
MKAVAMMLLLLLQGPAPIKPRTEQAVFINVFL